MKKDILKTVLLSFFIVSLILSLFHRWFVIQDRLKIFLYWHYGHGPFDRMTTGRYWMAGLVANGFILIFSTSFNLAGFYFTLVKKRQFRSFNPISVWTLSALPLAVGIYQIVAKNGQPPLSPFLAFACIFTSLAGLGLAFATGNLAQKGLAYLSMNYLAGAGLIPLLFFPIALELPQKGIMTVPTSYFLMLIACLLGISWQVIISKINNRLKKPLLEIKSLILAGLGTSYLLLPLMHYLLFTPRNNHYLTASSNFFADNLFLQILIFIFSITLTIGINKFEKGKN